MDLNALTSINEGVDPYQLHSDATLMLGSHANLHENEIFSYVTAMSCTVTEDEYGTLTK